MAISGQVVQTLDPRRFYVLRREDVSGVSGTGRVADGIQFTDGVVVIRWLTATSSTAVYDSIEHLQTVHGHNGATSVHFID